MRWAIPLAIVGCVAVAACESDPARAIKIADNKPAGEGRTSASPATPAPAGASSPEAAVAPAGPPAAAAAAQPDAKLRAAAAAAAPPGDGKWRPQGCPPPSERAGGPGEFKAAGPCAFEHHAVVSCETAPDDFFVTMSRPGARGSLVMAYINVEKYKGPGTYDGAQMFVGVQDKTSIFRWSSDEVTVTVGPDQKFAQLNETKLPSEPMLIDCSGPMLNYQCGGRKQDSPIENTEEIVSGTLMCGKIGTSDK